MLREKSGCGRRFRIFFAHVKCENKVGEGESFQRKEVTVGVNRTHIMVCGCCQKMSMPSVSLTGLNIKMSCMTYSPCCSPEQDIMSLDNCVYLSQRHWRFHVLPLILDFPY